jgi:DNA-binding MurR/RpiR family transcriptional regulator
VQLKEIDKLPCGMVHRGETGEVPPEWKFTMSYRPPESYEDLIKLIHDRYDDMSKSYQKIALYLTQNPNDVAVLSVNAIGAKCGIHASSFVRYAQSLGYKGFKELQSVFQRRLTTAAPGFDARVRALETELGGVREGEMAFLADLVARDVVVLSRFGAAPLIA